MLRIIILCLVMLAIVRLLGYQQELSDRNNENLYILKTCRGDIYCNYHDSRDTSYAQMKYVDYSTKHDVWILLKCVDSIIVLRENFWSCGPRDENLKYIDSTKK